MTSNGPDSSPHKAGGLWARMFGVNQNEDENAQQPEEQASDDSPAENAPENAPTAPTEEPAAPPIAKRAEPVPGEESVPMAKPIPTDSDTPESPPVAQGLPPMPNLSLDEDPIPTAEPSVDETEDLPTAEPTADIPEEVIPTAEPDPEVLEEVIPVAPTAEAPPPLAEPAVSEEPPVVSPAPEAVEPITEVAPSGPPEIVEPPAPPAQEVVPPVQEVVPPQEATAPPQEETAGPVTCPVCGSECPPKSEYCADCGCMFSPAQMSESGTPAAAAVGGGTGHTPPQFPLQERYKVGGLMSEKIGVHRYRGLDTQTDKPVIIVASAIPPQEQEAELVEAVAEAEPVNDENMEDFMPTFDEAPEVTDFVDGAVGWPGASWEKNVLETAAHPSLPTIVDHFAEGEFEYLILEDPQGMSLWDAWNDFDTNVTKQYTWLIQIAEGLQALHSAGAILEGLQPDFVNIGEDGRAVIFDLTDMLPIPLPPNPPVRGTLYSAPELQISPDSADARSDVYSFGAMLYSLEYLQHSLEEKDFEAQFQPKLITDRYPDVHPAFNRLIVKTFNRDMNTRFPTDEASQTDPTGFTELISTLKVCQRTFERVRLDIAAWTTTGMVRTGNEDAFAFLHAVESRQDDLTEYALILLTDGMGGYEAGEVAAAMAIKALREFLLQDPMFSAVAGKDAPDEAQFDIEKCKNLLHDGLKHANKEVFTASRTPGKGKRGMGCTAEAVYIDDRHLVVGHVGDSRTYHITNNTIKQLTRDQTLVARMVELGMLTEEEAEHHDRKNELQQAIGGQPDVEPGVYHAHLKQGDWIIVCSDGLTGHVPDKDLEQMLTRETANSAEEAARRLLNLTNLRGATDNTTLVVIRAS